VSARRSVALLLLVAAVGAALLVGCSSTKRSDATTTTSAPSSALRGELTVSAAASLTDVFSAIGDAFAQLHPAVTVRFNFGSSGQLATQVAEGAPADVAAFADTAPMEVLDDAGLLDAPAEVFATNELVVVTPPGNPAGIATLADLVDASTVSLCVETAPCGRFAAQLLSAADVELEESSVTRGRDVRSTLAAVTRGDADAAIVYVSDAVAVGDRVEVVDVPEAAGIVATYPIAGVADSDVRDVAAAFVRYVLSDEAQTLLRDAGFGPP
jgi:molybdate transport system substrate-binding protein